MHLGYSTALHFGDRGNFNLLEGMLVVSYWKEAFKVQIEFPERAADLKPRTESGLAV